MKDNEERVAESTPMDIDFFDPVVFDIVLLYLSAAWGSDALVCLGT